MTAEQKDKGVDARISSRLGSERLMRLGAAACLVLGLVISVAAWHRVSVAMEEEAQRTFDRFSVHADAVIQDRVRSHFFSIAGFHGLFAVSDQVSPAEFRQHFERMRGGRWHPGLVAVQYLERQPLAALPRATRQREGTGAVAWGPMVVKLTEPHEDGTGDASVASGLEDSARNELQAMINATLESGLPVATPPHVLDGATLGYSIYFAVYNRGQPIESVAQRRTALRGLVRGIFRTNSMFDDVLPQGQEDGYRVWIEDLDDEAAAGRVSVLFDSEPLGDPRLGTTPEALEKTYSVVSGERAWLIHTLRSPPASLTSAWPLTVLLSGLALTLGVWVVLRTVAAQYGRVSRLARQLSQEADQSAQRLHSIIEHSADGIVTIDAGARLLSANPAAERMFGRANADMVGRALPDLIDESTAPDLREWLRSGSACSDQPVGEREAIALRADGTRFPLAMAFNTMAGHQPGLRVGILRDVTERRRIESHMQHMAQHDTLTGLPNRMLLQTRLQEAIDQAQRLSQDPAQAHVGLIFVDLDRFKNFNDTLGHHVGDQLLKEAARRLQSVVRAHDTVARMGGDEFVILLPQLGSISDAERVAVKLLKALEPPVCAEGYELALSASLGLASWPDMATDAVTLMSRADAAMYRAKRAGRNGWAWFKPSDNALLPLKLRLDLDLRHASAHGELALHFQPQFECASGALVGAEVLLRWHHPQLGLLSPAEFIPIAEDNGLIVPIGQWVLHEALHQAVQWQALMPTPLQLAVNLSPRQMDTDAVVTMVADALAQSGLPPHLLTLEVTEGALMRDVESAARRLRQLAALGVWIAIDDFGVGFSSLSYLRDLPVHTLKIDRSFVQPLPADRAAVRLVGAIVALAHELQTKVVAEGVETTGQLEQLRAFGCDVAQGFLLGEPMPAKSFADLVRKASRTRVAANAVRWADQAILAP